MRQFFFFISEAFQGMKRSFLMSCIAVITIMLSLVVFGIFLFISIHLNRISEDMLAKFEVRVFVQQDVSVDQIQHLARLFEGYAAIKDVVFVDKYDAWDVFQSRYPQLSLSSFIQDNPLPHSFKLSLHSHENIVDFSQHLKSLSPYIDDVVYGGLLAKQVAKFSFIVRVVGIFLVCVLTLATLMIVVNTIRLTVMVRENEINIMSLVGATDGFIRAPFLFEGAFIGFVGSLCAVLLLKLMMFLFIFKLKTGLPYFPFLLNEGVAQQVYVVLVMTGSFLGVLGAYLSISKTLYAKKIN